MISKVSKQKNDQYLLFAGGVFDDEDFAYTITEQLEKSIPHLKPLIIANAAKPEFPLNHALNLDINSLISQIQSARFQIYRIDEDCSPLNFLALGISFALSSPFVMLRSKEIPAYLKGLTTPTFPNYTTLRKIMKEDINQFLHKNAFD